MPLKWTKEALTEQALKFESRIDWKTNHEKSYAAACRQGLLDELTSHMVRKTNFWNKETIKKEADKFDSIKEWRKQSPNSYDAACKKGLVPELVRGKRSLIKRRSDQDLANIAKNFSSRIEWFRKDKNSYTIARNRGLLEELCSHMKYVCGVSKPEQDIMEKVKEFYPKAHKVSFTNKDPEFYPAKRFHLDIYIPELRKGIEFDGEYWHSFEGLARSRKRLGWTDEQIENYHELKDLFFKSRNISVIHIRERDWMENKEYCIKQVFQFINIDYLDEDRE